MDVQTKDRPVGQSISSKKFEQIPDFLVIGAGKSGTTSLDNYLRQHPRIFVPDIKEPNFFGYELYSEKDFVNDPSELHHFRLSVTDLQSYLSLFKEAKPGQLKGETSNTYMYHSHAAERIRFYNPDVKLIAILRQPADRLYSRYMHLARENRVPTSRFEDCLDRNTVWWKRNDLVQEGFYFRHLAKFYEMFSHQNIRVFLHEDFNKDPHKILEEIFAFLGVDTAFRVDAGIRFNESGFIRNQTLNRLVGQKGIVINTLKKMLPDSVLTSFKNNLFIQKQLNGIRSKNLVKKKLDPAFMRQVTHEIYRDDIMDLQNLIRKDLSHWLK